MKSQNKNIIFAGAGVSLDLPSGVPISKSIIDNIIDSIAPNYQVANKIKNFNRSGFYELSGDFIRFEMLLDIISDFDKNLEVLDFLKSYKIPNQNHYNIAKSGINGDIIITPNFDCLIEEAIYSLGYTPLTICFEKDFSLDILNLEASIIPVIKIHGSFYKYLGKKNKRVSSKRTIQATLTNIGANNELYNLSKDKLYLLSNIFSKVVKLIFVGYSGLDDFDIMPSLNKLNLPKVLWIQHTNSDDPKNTLPELIKSIENINQSKRNAKENFIITQFKKSNISYLEVRTSSFLGKENETDSFPINNSISETISHANFIRNWSKKKLNKEEKYLLMGELFFRMSDYQNAYKYYTLIKENSYLCVKATRGKVNSKLQLGEFGKAKNLLNKFFSMQQDISNKELSRLLVLKFTAYYRTSSHHKNDIVYLTQLFSKAIETCKQNKMFEELAVCYKDYGIFMQDLDNFQSARKYYSYSIKYAKKAGSYRLISWTYYSWASLEMNMGQYTKAYELNKLSLETSSLLGDLKQVGYAEELSGSLNLIRGSYLDAIKSFRKSIYIDSSVGNKNESGTTWLLIGQAFFEIKRYKHSHFCFEKSLYELNHSDDKFFLYELFFFRISLFCKTDIKKAKEEILMFPTNTDLAIILRSIASELIKYSSNELHNNKALANLLNTLYGKKQANLFSSVIHILSILNIPLNVIELKYVNLALNLYLKANNINRLTNVRNWLNTKNIKE